jgi:hypothetical protein
MKETDGRNEKWFNPKEWRQIVVVNNFEKFRLYLHMTKVKLWIGLKKVIPSFFIESQRNVNTLHGQNGHFYFYSR